MLVMLTVWQCGTGVSPVKSNRQQQEARSWATLGAVSFVGQVVHLPLLFVGRDGKGWLNPEGYSVGGAFARNGCNLQKSG